MPATPPPPRRGPPERLEAWVVTGPLGHLYSALVDLAVYASRSALTRAQRTLSRAAKRFSARRER